MLTGLKNLLAELIALLSKHQAAVDEAISLIPDTASGEAIKTVADAVEADIVKAEATATVEAQTIATGDKDAAN